MPQADDHQPDHQIPAQIPPESVMTLASPLDSNQSSHHNGSVTKYAIFDSGCSRHVIGSSSLHLVTSRSMTAPLHLRLPDGTMHVSTEEMTTLAIFQSKSGPIRLELKNVVFIPAVTQFLISVKMLCKQQFSLKFTNQSCIMTKPDKSTIEFPQEPSDNLYRAAVTPPDHATTPPDLIALVQEKNPMNSEAVRDIIRVHHSMGHICAENMQKLMNSGALKRHDPQLVTLVVSHCEPCKLTKAKARKIPRESLSPAPSALHSIHCDEVMGLPCTPSGYTGCSLIVNRKTKFIDVKLIKKKNEAVQHIKDFVATAKTYGHQVMCLRTDSAKAFSVDKTFIEWLRANGIRQELSAPHSQYQNGFVERHIQTIQNMIASALHTSGMTKGYWGEAALWAKTTWNAIPRLDNDLKSPNFAVTGRQIEASFMHPFGCKAFARIPSDQQTKFQANAEECIFLNYDSRSKAFRVRPITKGKERQVLVRSERDVTFFDLVFPKKGEIEVPSAQTTPTHVNIDVGGPSAGPSNPNASVQPALQNSQNTPPLVIQVPPTPVTPALVLPASAQPPENTYFPSSFTEDVTLNPRDGLRSGKSFRSADINAILVEELEPEALAYHIGRVEDELDSVPVDNIINDHLAQISEDQSPMTIQEARAIPAFATAADDEMKMINDFKTFSLVPREEVPQGVVTHRPIWRFHYKADGKAKARLCFPGHKQEFGVNFTQTESPTLHLTSFRIFLSYAHLRKAIIRHIDIKNAYLHATINEDIFMEQPPGYVDPKFPNHVCKMNRALYRLKQVGRLWNKLADSILQSAGLIQNEYDPCVYLGSLDSDDWIIVLVFVNDFLITGSPRRVDRMISFLQSRLTISSNDEISRYIGISIRKDENDDLLLCQSDEIEACIKKFGMQGAKPVHSPSDPSLIHSECISDVAVNPSEYRSLIGALLYFAMCTRPDIAHAVIVCAQFQKSPSTRAWSAAKRILRYLVGTATKPLHIAPTSMDLCVYTDASHGDPSVERYSVSGAVIFLGGSPIHWISRKQKTPAHSSTEAELIAASTAARDALWIARLTKPIGTSFPLRVFIDNKSAILVASSEGMLRRVKHLEIQDLYVRSLHTKGLIDVCYVPSKKNWADLLTKSLKSSDQFKMLRDAVLHGLRGGDRN